MCRHPLYLFSLLGALGVGFSTETFTVPIIILLSFFVYYEFFVIKKEEERLGSKFGNEYDNYAKKVRNRLLPSFRNFTEPSSTAISPKAFRIGVFDLILFIIPAGLFEYMETLHLLSWIPTLYRIW